MLELEGKFKTAAELGLECNQYCGLIKTLAHMEAGRLHHAPKEFTTRRGHTFSGHFNMGSWRAGTECGTVACIGGTAELLGNCQLTGCPRGPIRELFFPDENFCNIGYQATPRQAAVALRGYLETGKTDWRRAMDTAP